MIDLSKAEGNVEPTKEILSQTSLSLADVTQLPSPDEYRLLSEAIAEHYSMPIESVVLGNGSDEIIEMVARSKAGDVSVSVVPTFGRLIDASLKFTDNTSECLTFSLDPNNSFAYTKKTHMLLIKFLRDSRASVLWLCSPTNPTGTTIHPTFIADIAEKFPDCLVVVDEVFIDFLNNNAVQSAKSLTMKYRNVVVISSFSKTWGLAGLRLGYSFIHPKTRPTIIKYKIMFNITAPTARIAQQCIENNTYKKECIDAMHKNRAVLLERVAAIPYLDVISNSEINLICLRLINRLDIYEKLKARGILTKSLESTKGMENLGYVRVRIPASEYELHALIEALDNLS